MSFRIKNPNIGDDQINAMISTLDNVNTCVFTKDELKFLCIHFQKLSEGNDTISRDNFQKALILKSSALIDNIFRVFDEDKDNCISFKEYINNLILMSPMASYDEKLKFSFNIYDKDGDGYISHDDLKTVITAIMVENGLVATNDNIQEILEITMKEASPEKAGFIAYEEYIKLVSSRPYLLTHFTINISGIIMQYKA